MNVRILALASMALAGAAAAQAQTPAPPSPTAGAPAAKPSEVATPEALVAACYDVISGPAGPRDWMRFRSLFMPTARMTVVSVGGDGAVRLRVLAVDDFVARAGEGMAKEGFFEKGVRNRTWRWGHTATIRSVYESRHAPGDPTPFASGVNTWNLVSDGSRWWVASLQWEAASSALPVPTDLSR